MAMSMKLNTPTPTSTAAASYATPLLIPTPSIRPPPRRVSTSIRSSAQGRDGASTRVDRRNLLLGLGSMYGATTAAGIARGDPVQPPDLTACHPANYPDGYNDNHPVQCCPPYDLSKIPDPIPSYVLPTNAPLRTRRPAHKLNTSEIERFKTAVQKMKALPSDHPWNFMRQAQIHCVYCNEGYNQKGYDVPLQIHFSALFLPWHRWYIYFFEKILGKIIGDDTFALPFWNYDVEEGMKIPDPYKESSSSLYNPNRNMRHKDELINLNWDYNLEDTPVPPNVVDENLTLLAKLFQDDNLANPNLFMGDPVPAGQYVNSATLNLTMGALESMHNNVHKWVGKVEPPNMDMGNFFSAGRDLIFYAHHANVDRLWDIYRNKRNNVNEFGDEWLDAKFVFYDENQKIVTVTTRQSLDIQAMKYENEDVPTKYTTLPKGNPKPAPSGSPTEFGPSRRTLDRNIVVTVKRPIKAFRTLEKIFHHVEVLSVDGIELTTPDAASFEVYLSNSRQDKCELVGTFSRVRHNNTHLGGLFNRMRYAVGITGVVDRIGASADETVVVTLVPRTGNVTVGGVHIELGLKQLF